ncbi:MAG: choice-of-anchor L domain-containing protein [Bacteroidota bacterium]|nr:choice-of-anchor L domain-containing protein [Bacteroidota bacterium]
MLNVLASKAQLSVSTTSNANTLVNTIVGSGVIVTNVTLNCNGQATGTFTSSGTNLGLSSGIVLASGQAVEAIGPNNSPGGSLFSAGAGCFNSGETFFDPNILAAEPLAKYDGCVLEFDIKPVCNTLQIDYVFASEEYPEFVGAGYNDVFGFFITGPNPGGGFYSGTNIAVLPGSSSPVAIDNVNPGSPYYVDNGGGGSIQYDGFTVPLTASASVVQCQTYRLKLAIADAGDCQYSSAVFLAAKGITCPASQVPVVSASSTALNCGNDGTATATVQNSSGPISYNWQPGGQTTQTATNLAAGNYTCTVGYTLPCPYTQTVSVNVAGNNVLTLNTSSQNAYCNNPTGTASVNYVGGTPPYSTPQWNTVPPEAGNTIDSLLPGIYTVSIADATGCMVNKDVTVGNTTPNINITSSILQSTCGSSNGDIEITDVTGGNTPYSYNWSTTPPSSSQSVFNVSAGSYTITVTDAENCVGSKVVNLPNVDSVMIDPYSLNEYCYQSNGEIHSPVLNGVAPYSWVWSHSLTLNDSVATGLSAGSYSFAVTDNVGCTARGNITITNIRDDFTGNIYTSPPEPVANQNFILGISLPSIWSLDYIELADGSTRSNETEVVMNYAEYGNYGAVFYVESSNGCKDTISYEIFVKDFMTIYIPNSFTPNTDRVNKVWYVYGTLVKEIVIYVYDRWGQKIFESNDLEQGWDGTYKGKLCESDTYVYKVEALDFFDEKRKFVGHVHLIR